MPLVGSAPVQRAEQRAGQAQEQAARSITGFSGHVRDTFDDLTQTVSELRDYYHARDARQGDYAERNF